MAKVLIFGSNGLLGQNLVKIFMVKHDVVTASLEKQSFIPQYNLEYHSIDLIRRGDTRELITRLSPDIIINASAYTNVDKCEQEREACWAINVHAVENIIGSVKNPKTVLVQISTDYVFNGKNSPYNENSETEPLGVYGHSKLAAENIVKNCPLEYLIIRTQVLFGAGNEIRPNFVIWVVEQLKNDNHIHVVNDQISSPTYAPDLSTAILNLLENQAYGVFHVSSESSISRFDFACKIADIFNLNKDLIEMTDTTQLKQNAVRPANSTFAIDKLINYSKWEPHSLEQALILLKEELKS